jgi:LCP family protein required for cell wall assembly
MPRKKKQQTSGDDAQQLFRSSAATKYTSQRKKRRHHKILRTTLVVVGCVIAAGAVAAWLYISNINSRLNDGIDSSLRSTLSTTEDGQPFYMLLLGIDKDEDRAEGSEYGSSDSAYRSDSIMLVRIDPENNKVTLVSIHRDTLVDLGEHGEQKINAAYSIGGAAYATQVIEEFAGVSISHYAEIDMDGMASVVDAVGGIDVDLPIAVKDPNYTGLNLEAGEQHLDGQTAALLCRARHAYDNYGDGDRYRAANQRIIIMAIAKKVLASDPATMATTVSDLANMVNTDMDVSSIVSLATQMKDLDVDTDIMSGMEPTTSTYKNDTWYEICDTDAWKTMMERVDQGLSPTEDGTDDAVESNTAAELGDDSSSNTSSSSDSNSDTTSNSNSQ